MSHNWRVLILYLFLVYVIPVVIAVGAIRLIICRIKGNRISDIILGNVSNTLNGIKVKLKILKKMSEAERRRMRIWFAVLTGIYIVQLIVVHAFAVVRMNPLLIRCLYGSSVVMGALGEGLYYLSFLFAGMCIYMHFTERRLYGFYAIGMAVMLFRLLGFYQNIMNRFGEIAFYDKRPLLLLFCDDFSSMTILMLLWIGSRYEKKQGILRQAFSTPHRAGIVFAVCTLLIAVNIIYMAIPKKEIYVRVPKYSYYIMPDGVGEPEHIRVDSGFGFPVVLDFSLCGDEYGVFQSDTGEMVSGSGDICWWRYRLNLYIIFGCIGIILYGIVLSNRKRLNFKVGLAVLVIIFLVFTVNAIIICCRYRISAGFLIGLAVLWILFLYLICIPYTYKYEKERYEAMSVIAVAAMFIFGVWWDSQEYILDNFLGMPVWIASLWGMWEIRSHMLAWKERERLEFWENEDMNAAVMDDEGEAVSDWKYREAYDISEKKSIKSWFIANLVIHIAVMIWMKLPV